MNIVKDRIKLEVKLIKKFEYNFYAENGYSKPMFKPLLEIKKAKLNKKTSKTRIVFMNNYKLDTPDKQYNAVYEYFNKYNLMQYLDIEKPKKRKWDIRIKIKDNVDIQTLYAYCKIKGYIK